MIKEAIEKIVNKENLTYDEAYTVMNEIMNGETSQVQNAAFLAALSTKSAGFETIEEIGGCAEAMREHALRVEHDMSVLDIVGTGGDKANTFNISTTTAFVLAAAGIRIAKHGNRAASSKSGTADCLEALGINISLAPEKCVELLEKTGICFMFAQKYHTSMKYVGAVRKELGIRTVFNILGPLTNPSHPDMMLLGVYDEYLVEVVANVLMNLGVKRGMVVYGNDKMDEISLSDTTTICRFEGGKSSKFIFDPRDEGMELCSKKDLEGGTPEENAETTLSILRGEEKGPKRNIVLLNAAAGLCIAGKATDMKDGIAKAAEIIDSGKALAKLEELKEASNNEE